MTRITTLLSLFLLLPGPGCAGNTPSPDPDVRPRPRERRRATPPVARRRARPAPPSLLTPTKTTVKGWKVEVALEPEKRTFMLGEPIFMSYVVRNRAGVDLLIPEGGDYRNHLGRPESYKCRISPRGGKPLPVRKIGPAFGGISSNRRLPAGGEFRRELFLPNWARIKKPGVYEIRCQRDLTLLPSTATQIPHRRTGRQVTARVLVRVTPTDARRLGKLINELGGLLLSKNSKHQRKASQALAAIGDPRAVAHWVKAYRAGGYTRRFRAIWALGKYKTLAALAGLRLCLKDKNKALRLSCVQSLSGNAHPKAWPTLKRLAKDKDHNVRLTVLHAAAKRPCKDTGALIKRLTKDPSPVVASEARRYRKRCPKP